MKDKVLVLCPTGIGNFLLALPLISQLSKVYDVDVCIKQFNIPIAKRFSFLIKDIIIYKSNWLKNVINIRRTKYKSIYYTFPGHQKKLLLLLLLAKSENRFGYKFGNSLLYYFLPLFKVPAKPESESIFNLRLFDDSKNLEFILSLKNQLTILNKSIKKQKRICIHPGSDDGPIGILKRYPIEKWNKLFNMILNKYPSYNISIIIGPKETEYENLFIKDSRITFYKDSLNNLIDFLIGSSILVGNDSGISHLASFCNLPVVTLFGPVDKIKSQPIFNSHPINIELDCSPCQKIGVPVQCTNSIYKLCMKSITPELILKKISQLIDE